MDFFDGLFSQLSVSLSISLFSSSTKFMFQIDGSLTSISIMAFDPYESWKGISLVVDYEEQR